MSSDTEPIVRVLVTNPPAPAKTCTVHTSFLTLTFAGGGTVQTLRALANAPFRRRALITLPADNTHTVFLCGSNADAQQLSGAPILCGGNPVELVGTDEVWIGYNGAASIQVGVIAEYESYS